MLNPIERFLSRFDPRNDGCWLWTGTPLKGGYGQITVDGHTYVAHRYSYELFIGPIPDGLELDHTCHNPLSCQSGDACPHRSCVNPWHLEPVTKQVNSLRSGNPELTRGRTKLRTHCKRGHEFSETNIRWGYGENGHRTRSCLICMKTKMLERYYRIQREREIGREL